MSKVAEKKLKTYVIGSKVRAVSEVLQVLKSDFDRLLKNYMSLSEDIKIYADLNESTGNIVFNVQFETKEIYDIGKVLS